MNKKPFVKSLNDLASISAYLTRIGAEPRSIKNAVVKVLSGQYWRDVATIRFDKVTGEVIVAGDAEAGDTSEFAPTKDEAKAIADEVRLFDWPENSPVREWPRSSEPEELRKTDPSRVFTFRDLDGNIAMKQLRGYEHRGDPKYVTYSYWTDGVVRKMEPDGPLPLWGLEQLKDHSIVFLHEGAKAARRVTEMVAAKTEQAAAELANHPWGEELSGAAHLGWIGGALSPHRTDWSVLKKRGVSCVFIVPDNDPVGRSAVRKIAKHLYCPTFAVEFDDAWPSGFDLADDWPESMFKMIEAGRHYVGPAFRDVLKPATWATDLKSVPGSRVKKFGNARPHFTAQWAYVHEIDRFVNLNFPNIRKAPPQFNALVRPFSDVTDTASLVLKSYEQGQIAKLAYRPGEEAGRINVDGASALNVFQPSRIEPVAGDPTPWLEFLEYLIPEEGERKEVEKWSATLIAKLGTRMEYGLMLISETQGTGKNTFGAAILAPIVGMHNTGFPSVKSIVESGFNSWLVHKRLVFVGEIYEGQSWKAYNTLKSLITDKEVDVNEKHERTYTSENWVHIVACSNSKRALKIEEDDRRWFYPRVTETPWPKEKFRRLREWLAAGGLSIIAHWAKHYGDYVEAGDRAPMTERKREVIEESRSDEERALAELCAAMAEDGEAIAFSTAEAFSVVKAMARGTIYVRAYDLGKAMASAGWTKCGEAEGSNGQGKLKIRGSYHVVFLSPKAKEAVDALEGMSAKRDYIRALEEEGRKRLSGIQIM